MPLKRTYSRYTSQAITLLGKQIENARKERHWTVKELAERAGINRNTLQKIEDGDPRCEIGLVFEVASLLGLKLFESDDAQLVTKIEMLNDKIALLPKSVRLRTKDVDDDF